MLSRAGRRRDAPGQFAGSASLYQYFGATAVILVLVSLLPPNRLDRWLRFAASSAESEPR